MSRSQRLLEAACTVDSATLLRALEEDTTAHDMSAACTSGALLGRGGNAHVYRAPALAALLKCGGGVAVRKEPCRSSSLHPERSLVTLPHGSIAAPYVAALPQGGPVVGAVVGAFVTQLVACNATPHFVVQHAAANYDGFTYTAMTEAIPCPRLAHATSADAAIAASSPQDMPALADAVLLCTLHALAIAQCTAGFVHGDLCTKNILMSHVDERTQVTCGDMLWRGADEHTYQWVLPESSTRGRVTIPASALQHCLPMICDFGGSSAFHVYAGQHQARRGVAFISTFDPASKGVMDAAKRTLIGLAGEDADVFVSGLPSSMQDPYAADYADALCVATLQRANAGAVQVARALRRAVRYSAKRWRLPPGECMAYDAQYLICCMVRDIRDARTLRGAEQHPDTLAEYAARHLFDRCDGAQRHGACYATKSGGVSALGVLQFFALSDVAGGSATLRRRWHQWTGAPRAQANAAYDVQSRAARRANNGAVYCDKDAHVQNKINLASAYAKVATSLSKRGASQQ